MVQEAGVAWTIFRFRTHALLCATGSVMSHILQQFVAIYTLELVLWELLFFLEPERKTV